MLKVVRSKGKGPAANGSCVASGHTEPGLTKHMGSRAWFPVWSCPWPGGVGAGPRFAAGLSWLRAGLVRRACPVGSCLGSSLSRQQRSWLGSSWSSSRAQVLCCLCQHLCPIWGDVGPLAPETTMGVPRPRLCSLPLQRSVRSHLVQFCDCGDFDEQWDFLHWCEAGGTGSAAVSAVCCTCGWYFASSLPPPPLSPQPHSFKYVLIMAA